MAVLVRLAGRRENVRARSALAWLLCAAPPSAQREAEQAQTEQRRTPAGLPPDPVGATGRLTRRRLAGSASSARPGTRGRCATVAVGNAAAGRPACTGVRTTALGRDRAT